MKQYIVDAFTDQVFAGNPAAICVLDRWLPEDLMQKITRENNLSETAFAVKTGETYHLRWFTPGGEIDLCGHATLACAFVILTQLEPNGDRVSFDTLSGRLTVQRKGDLFEMDFPAYELTKVPVTPAMTEALGAQPSAAYLGRDLLCVFEDEATVRTMTPDLDKVKTLDGLLHHVTAPGRESDCVSRSFCPKCGIPEDPVCGSGHCHIVPYWARVLGREELVAWQASPRGGTLYCKLEGNRVKLAGKAALFSQAEIFLPNQG